MDKFIEVIDLVHKYHTDEEENIAVDNVSLTINKGDFVALLGRNGSGKSTLAKHFNGILLPTSGKVFVDGMDTMNEEDIFKIRQRIGLVFQNPDNQLIATVVEDDVAFGPENLGIEPEEIRKRVDEALKIVGMSEFSKKEPHNLSGGQKQRIAIAGILAMKPDAIVFDESTAMLDPVGRKEVIDTAIKLNKEKGITIIMITHYMEEAVQADRVIIMEHGKIQIDSTPKEIFSDKDKISELGLEMPTMTQLSNDLSKRGLDIDSNILTVEEMTKALCQLKLKI